MSRFGKPQRHIKGIQQDASRSRSEEAFKQSIIEYQKGNLEGAKIGLEKTLQADKANSFALGFLATVEKALGNNERALNLFKRSTDISQNNSDILHNYSILLVEKDPEKAISLSNQAINISPANSSYLERNGYLKWQAGDLDGALEATLKAIRLNPCSVDAHMNMGGICKDLGNLDQALASTLKSLELKQDNPTAHMNLGAIYKDLGNLDQALASTLKSLELKQDNPTAHMNLGCLYKDFGNLDQALASTLKSLELKQDNPTAHMNLGCIYKGLSNLDSALASPLKSLELKPENPDAHLNLGEIYFDLGDHQKAEKEFVLAKDLANQQKDAVIRGIAACRFSKGDYSSALELIKNLPVTESMWKNNTTPKDAEIKSIVVAKLESEYSRNFARGAVKVSTTEEKKSLIKITYREVEDELIAELYAIRTRKLSQTIDARNGSGFCTDFKLLSHSSPQIKKLEADLKNIIEKFLKKECCSLKYDSFFNIFKAGSGTTPHRHLGSQDKKFNLFRHKYSLVYYIDPGDQSCDQPGILRCMNQRSRFCPKKG